jgi:tetratricopeptide (TPR) repeat protein
VRRLVDLRRRISGGASLPLPHYLSRPPLPDSLVSRLSKRGYPVPARVEARGGSLPDARRFRGALPLLEDMHLRVDLVGFGAVAHVEENLLKPDPESLFSLLNLAQGNLFNETDPALGRAAQYLSAAQRLYPFDPDVYHLLAHLAYQQKRLGDAELLLQVAQHLRPRYPGEIAYDLACAYALQGKKTEALVELRKGIDLGFRDYSHLSTDPDLESLRGDPGYLNVMREEFPAP